MATQGYVQLPTDVANTGKKEDHVVVSPSGNYREVISIGSPDADSDYAPVDATAGLKVNLGSDNDIAITDGSDVNAGATTDVAVTGDNSGTLSAKLRGINKILANVWDSVNSRLNVYIQNTTLAATQSGTWTVQPGNTANTTAWKVDGSAVTQPVSAASLPLPTGAATAALQTQPGVDIGDVTINNASGAAAVNIQDGGNTITVDGTVTAAQATASNLNAQVVGELANDAVDSGNPIKIGGKAVSAAPTAVAAADRVNGLFDLWGRLFTRHGAQAPAASTWTGVHVPATATQATKTQASAGAGKRNVCTGFTFTICAGGSAPTPTTPVTVKIIDGSSGGGTILWQSNITMPATAGGIVSFNRSNLWLVGTAATAMTAEFSAAGPTNTYESVAFDGVIIEE